MGYFNGVKLNYPLDFDKKSDDGEWLRGWSTYSNGTCTQYHSLSSGRWASIQTRCKVGGSHQKKFPTYIGSKNDFMDFQEFVEWSRGEVGYNLKDVDGRNWALDKDFVILGNLSYNPKSCIFVPGVVNSFLALKPLTGDVRMHGVSWNTSVKKYSSRIIIEGKRTLLGYSDNTYECHLKWQWAKKNIAESLISRFSKNGDIYHPKLVEALINITEKLSKDINDGKITERFL